MPKYYAYYDVSPAVSLEVFEALDGSLSVAFSCQDRSVIFDASEIRQALSIITDVCIQNNERALGVAIVGLFGGA